MTHLGRRFFVVSISLLLAMFGAATIAVAKEKLVSVKHSPANWAGEAKCKSKYKAFKDRKGKRWEAATTSVLRKECWSCPRTAPDRTLAPVTSKKACKRGSYKKYKKATGPKNPTGKFVKTKCEKGWFLNIGSGKCYSCQGYKRTVKSVKGPKACSKKIKATKTKALKRGKPGCGKGKFRKGLSDQCYSCPQGYKRGLATGKDLTKVRKACMRVTINPPKLRIKPPKKLLARAMREIQPYTDLIAAAVLSMPKAQKALLSGKDPKSYRDKALTDAIEKFNSKAKRRAEAASNIQVASAGTDFGPLAATQEAALQVPPIRHWSIGAVGDATSPFLIGGNGSAEFVWRTGQAKPIGLLMGVSATVGAPMPGADGSVFFGLYTVSKEQLKKFSWSVEIGYRVGKVAKTASPAGVLMIPLPPGKMPNGLDVQAIFLFNNDPGKKGPKFAGLVIGTGVGSPGGEADIGVNFSHLIEF